MGIEEILNKIETKYIFKKSIKDNFITVSSRRALDYPNLFWSTHTSMALLKEDKDGTNEKSEEQIYNDELKEYLNSTNDHCAFFIKGDVGTGKSELIWYLYSRIKKDEDFQNDQLRIINIPKNRNWLTIVDILKNEFMTILAIDEKRRKELFKDDPNYLEKLNNEIETDSQLVSINLSSLILKELRKLNLLKSEKEVEAENKKYKLKDSEQKIITTILDNINDLRNQEDSQDLDDDRKKNSYLFNINNSREIIESLEWRYHDATTEEKVNCLNDALRDVICNTYNVRSINQILDICIEQYRNKKQNKEKLPVILLIIEDFGLRGKDAEDIGKIINEDTYPINFLIAGTPDAFDDIIVSGSLKERIQIFWTTLGSTSKVSTFLKVNNIWDYFLKYLAFFKKDLKRRLDQNKPNHGIIINDLDPFPFSKTFIKRLYDNLDEELKKPRDFIKKIALILTEYASGINPYKHASDKVEYLKTHGIGDDETIQRIFELDNSEADKISFIKWFGEKENDMIIIDENISQRFGIELTRYEASVSQSGQSPQELQSPQVPQTPQLPQEEIDLFQERYDEIDDFSSKFDMWFSSLNDTLNVNTALKSGFLHVFDNMTDGFKIYNSFSVDSTYILGFIRFQKGDHKQNISPTFNLPFSLPPIIIDNYPKKDIRKILKLGVLYTKGSDFSEDFPKRLENEKKILTENFIQDYYMQLNNWIISFENKFYTKIIEECTKHFLKAYMRQFKDSFYKFLFFIVYTEKIKEDPLCSDDGKTLYKYINRTKSKAKNSLIKIEASDFENDDLRNKFEGYIEFLPHFTNIIKNLLEYPEGEDILKYISWIFEDSSIPLIKSNLKSGGSRTDFLQKINMPDKITTLYKKSLSNYGDLEKGTNDNDRTEFIEKIGHLKNITDLPLTELNSLFKESEHLIKENKALISNLKDLQNHLRSDEFKSFKKDYILLKEEFESRHKSQILNPYYGILNKKIDELDFVITYDKVMEIINPKEININERKLTEIKDIL